MQMPAGDPEANSGTATFRVADVTALLLSVTKLFETGSDVLFRKDTVPVRDETANIVAKLEKRNGLYMATLAVKHPGLSRGSSVSATSFLDICGYT